MIHMGIWLEFQVLFNSSGEALGIGISNTLAGEANAVDS